MARPEAEVWVIAGDGGFQMTQCELATLQQEKLDIKIAVVNNGYLGMVRQWQEFFYDKRYASTPMLSPDFVKLADAYGIAGHRVTKRSEVASTVQAVRASGQPALIDFRVEKEEAVYPMVPAGADLHAMIRRPADGRGGDGVKHTLVARVLDEPGVLNRVASLFRRRAFNIDSLTVGHSEQSHVSRMTIVVDTGGPPAALVAENLRKLVPVLDVEDVTHRPTVSRDLALVRVRCAPGERSQMADLVAIFRGKIVDVAAGVRDRRGHGGRGQGGRPRGPAARARDPGDGADGQGRPRPRQQDGRKTRVTDWRSRPPTATALNRTLERRNRHGHGSITTRTPTSSTSRARRSRSSATGARAMPTPSTFGTAASA